MNTNNTKNNSGRLITIGIIVGVILLLSLIGSNCSSTCIEDGCDRPRANNSYWCTYHESIHYLAHEMEQSK